MKGPAAVALLLWLGSQAMAQEAARDFSLPLPLFGSASAWNQLASSAAVLPTSGEQILVLYRVLLGDRKGLVPAGFGAANVFPFPIVNSSDFSMPIGRAGQTLQRVRLRRYDGGPGSVSPKLTRNADGTVTTPAPAVAVRPSGPQDTNADGHLVIVDLASNLAYDFWQATTALDANGNSLGGGRSGSVVLEAGAVDVFSLAGSGTNPPRQASARATGVALLAGLIVPEDVERGAIAHALGFVIPGPRNLNTADPSNPLSSDFVYPASLTETDFYSTNPLALISGQRIRLRTSIVDDNGMIIDETTLAPVTRMFADALRRYGAYLVDGAGGFGFYAEDVHTAVLRLTEDEVNTLIGASAGSRLPQNKTKWEVVIDKLNADLERIPLASGPWYDYGPGKRDPAAAVYATANIEVIEPAIRGSGRRRIVRP